MRTGSQLSRFTAAVHRRAVMMRVLEGAGVGLAIAAAGAVLLLVLGMPPAFVMVLAGAGAVIGALAGWNRRPSRLAAVIEADTQLKTQDLLSSAMLAGEDAFGQAVRAMAEHAAGMFSPSRVVLNRFGVRVWSGIGLGWAMVLVVGLLMNGAADSRAGDDSPSTARNPRTAVTPRVGPTQSSARQGIGRERAVGEDRNFGQAESVTSPTGSGDGKSQAPGQASSGAGGGVSQTGRASVEPSRPGRALGTASERGESAGGAGAPTRGGNGESAGGGGAQQADRNAAPWQSSNWPAARVEALQAVEDGRVPDAYRDLVRDYFRNE